MSQSSQSLCGNSQDNASKPPSVSTQLGTGPPGPGCDNEDEHTSAACLNKETIACDEVEPSVEVLGEQQPNSSLRKSTSSDLFESQEVEVIEREISVAASKYRRNKSSDLFESDCITDHCPGCQVVDAPPKRRSSGSAAGTKHTRPYKMFKAQGGIQSMQKLGASSSTVRAQHLQEISEKDVDLTVEETSEQSRQCLASNAAGIEAAQILLLTIEKAPPVLAADMTDVKIGPTDIKEAFNWTPRFKANMLLAEKNAEACTDRCPKDAHGTRSGSHQ